MAIPQPVTFSEPMLSKYDWSPTARIYLKAFKLVKEGVEILYKSNFTDGKGISLTAYGYLTENSILQSFPLTMFPKILQLCENNLKTNEHFFEAVLLSYALHHFESRLSERSSEESCKVDMKKAACLQNIFTLSKELSLTAPVAKTPMSLIKPTVAGFMYCIGIWQQHMSFVKLMKKQLKLVKILCFVAHLSMSPRGCLGMP